MRLLTHTKCLMMTTSCQSKTGGVGIAVFGDVHLGHPTTPTSHIIANMHKYLLGNSAVLQCKMIVVNGDFFDGLLTLHSDESYAIIAFINELLRYCKTNGIILRVVDGTDSHEYKQAQWFVEINEHNNIGCDVKYVTALSIEHVESLGLNVLYVPDEWNIDASVTFKQVKELMLDRGLDKVDVTFMHGAFYYQLQGEQTISRHNPGDYLGITRHYITINHVHKHSVFKRIVAPGSFDRIAHSEERAKGYVILNIVPNDPESSSWEFVENPGAWKYVTVCPTETSDYGLMHAEIEKCILNLPVGSRVRLECVRGGSAHGFYDQIKQHFGQYHWKIELTSVEESTVDPSVLETMSLYSTVSLTAENVTAAVEAEIPDDFQHKGLALELLTALL